MILKINEYKQLIIDTVTKAENRKWINKESGEVIKSFLNTDELTIGFVGKMKMGKSSIINALVFQDDVLPSSSIPMTATLTIIKYGEQKSATVNIITEADFDEICRIKDVKDNLESEEKVKSAMEIYEAIVSIDNYKNLFGKSQVIELSDYVNYIGANGKFSAMAKSVVFTLPKKELLGVTIVDTPGFNDPISSRDDETFNFLSHSNVIVLVQNPYAAFDITDLNLLESQISKAGIGKMVIAINQFDALGNVSWENELNKRITKKEKIIIESGNSIIKELLKDSKIIPVSSIMALIGYLKKQGVKVLADNPQINFFYAKLQEEFPELETIDDFINKSNILILETEINNIVSEQKGIILLDAPLKKISEMLITTIQVKENDVKNNLSTIKELNDGIPDIEEQKREFKNFIEILFDRFSISSIQNTLLDSIKSTLSKLQSKRASYISEITNKSYPDPKLFHKQQMKKLNHENIQRLYMDMNSEIRSILNDLNGVIKSQVLDEINTIISYLTCHLPSNMKNIHGKFLEKLKNELNTSIPSFISVAINVPSVDVPSNSAFNKQTAVTYYKNIFNSSYSDDCLNEFLIEFRKYVRDIKDDFRKNAYDIRYEQERVFDAANDENKSLQLILEKEKEIQILNTDIDEIKDILDKLKSITVNTD